MRQQSLSRRVLHNLTTAIFLLILTLILFSCDSSTASGGDDGGRLYVKFQNNESSTYSINTLIVQPMGRTNESTTPQGDWSNNVLPSGTILAPGEFVKFYLDIPNLDWSRYRLGVLGANGNTIMLHEQAGWNDTDPSITHWGGDERTVTPTVKDSYNSNLIVITGWSEYAGMID